MSTTSATILAHIVAELEEHRDAIEHCGDREQLRQQMPRGGARNAVDCALWDLEAKRAGTDARQLARIEDARALVTTFTLGADEPEAMAEGARRYTNARAIKVKLTGELGLDVRRVAAIRAARPDVWLGVDANQGFTRKDLDPLVDALSAHRVSLLEQPLPREAKRTSMAIAARSRSRPTKVRWASMMSRVSSAGSTCSTSSSTSAAASPKRC